MLYKSGVLEYSKIRKDTGDEGPKTKQLDMTNCARRDSKQRLAVTIVTHKGKECKIKFTSQTEKDQWCNAFDLVSGSSTPIRAVKADRAKAANLLHSML